MTKEEELWFAWGAGDTASRDILVQKYMPLATGIAKEFYRTNSHGFSYDEIYSFACCGLFDAVRKYRQENNASFVTYARLRIRGEILDSMRKEGLVPAYLVRWRNRILSTESNDSVDIAQQLNVDTSTVIDMLTAIEQYQTFSITPEIENNFACAVESFDASVVNRLALLQAIKELNEREQRIILYYYYMSWTQREIAEQLCCTEANVCLQRKRILRKLRKIINE